MRTESKVESRVAASVWLRVSAALVDGVIWGMILAVFIVLVLIAGAKDSACLRLLLIIVILAYPTLVVLMAAIQGQSPGKALIGIRVVRVGGRDIGLGRAIVQEWFGKPISLLPLIIPLGFFWIFFDRKGQGWHDKLANTMVVDDR